MKNELNDLIQEIVNFGQVISFTGNPGDSNSQHACQLFSSYLDNRFTDIKANFHITDCEDNINWTVSEITQLGYLISSQENSTTPNTQWIHELSQHCKELQRNKMTAA